MKCDEVIRLLAQGTGARSQQAREHLHTCPECALFLEALGSARSAHPPPDPDSALIERIRADLKPVRQIRSAGFYFLLFLGSVLALTAIAFALKPSTAGLKALGAGRAFGMLGAVSFAVITLTYLSTRLMVPGSRFRISARSGLAVSGLVIMAAVLALIPETRHQHFVKTAWSCFLLGLPFGLVSAAAAHLILFQGAPLWTPMTGLTAGTLGGLSGLAFLEVYCPLLDRGHVTFGHVTVPLVAGLFAALLHWWWSRTSV